MWLEQAVFYVFSVLLILSSVMVVSSRNPVRGVLFLVLAFFATSALWLLLRAEFLALILIIVYVGAVMTLFLFVVMMLDLDIAPKNQGFVRYLPLGVLVFALLIATMVMVFTSHKFSLPLTSELAPSTLSNVEQLGMVLYTQYMLPFELSGVLLLVAMIAAISLAFRGRRNNTKAQRIHEQIATRAEQRLKMINIPAEKR